jgi:hypothetical protein
MMEKPYLGMLGYTAEGRPFLDLDVDVDDARERARENDLSEYILVPRRDNAHDHLGYIRNEEGEYEKKTTRLAVFRHLLSAGVGGVPSREDVGLD